MIVFLVCMTPDTHSDLSDLCHLAAAFTCIGTPLMLSALTSISTMLGLTLIAYTGRHRFRDVIYQKIQHRELEVLEKFGLDDGTGKMDLREFIIVSAVRMKAIDPKLIKLLVHTFHHYDLKRDGFIYHQDIVERYHELEFGKRLNHSRDVIPSESSKSSLPLHHHEEKKPQDQNAYENPILDPSEHEHSESDAL